MSSLVFDKIKEFFGFQEETEIEPSTPIKEEKKATLKPFKGSLVHSQNSKPFTPSEIKIEEPRIYEDSLNIATQLREKKPVIVNLKFLDTTASKRLIDFVCGTAYAINGHMMKIGENIFLFTPENVLIANSEDKSTLQQGIEQEEKEVFFKKVAGI
jgi:cell division inhibitor SepF